MDLKGDGVALDRTGPNCGREAWAEEGADTGSSHAATDSCKLCTLKVHMVRSWSVHSCYLQIIPINYTI